MASLVPEVRIIGLFAEFVFLIVEEASGRNFVRFQDLVVLKMKETRTSYIVAKTLATMWFFVGGSSYTLFVGGAMYLTFKAEMSIKWIPESESKNDIGQWSTWTAVGLALFAAIIHRIVAKPTDGKKKKIILVDPEIDVGEAHDDAFRTFRTKMIRKKFGQFFHHILADSKYKWLEFRYWWYHTIEASASNASEDEKRK